MSKKKKEIRFDALLNKVLYFGNLKKPYVLHLDGVDYSFADTVEIIPFVRKLGWNVIERKAWA